MWLTEQIGPVGAEGEGVERQGPDITDDDRPAHNAGDIRMAWKGVIQIRKAGAVTSVGQRQTNVGIARRQGDQAPNSKGEWRSAAANANGQAKHREDAAADHAANNHGDELKEPEFLAKAPKHVLEKLQTQKDLIQTQLTEIEAKLNLY